MKPIGGDVDASSPPPRRRSITSHQAFLVTALAGLVVSILLLGTPESESELPWSGMVRDVVLDREAVDAALTNAAHPRLHARTPGSLIVLMPLRIVPRDDLTMYMAMVNSLALGLIAAAGVAMRRVSRLAGLVCGIGLAASAAYIQSLYHGSTFLPFGAALLWGWVWLERDRSVGAGILIAIAGVGRIWPLLLLVPMWRRGQRKAVAAATVAATALTLLGLSFSGLTLSESVNSIRNGGATWITAEHNGSAASWLEHLGTAGIVMATLAVLAVWLLGMLRSPDLRVDLLWTLPIAVFVSPLAWLPYALVLFPVALLAIGRPLSNIAISGVAFIQLVGYRGMSDQWVTTLTMLLILFAVWHTHLKSHSGIGAYHANHRPVLETQA